MRLSTHAASCGRGAAVNDAADVTDIHQCGGEHLSIVRSTEKKQCPGIRVDDTVSRSHVRVCQDSEHVAHYIFGPALWRNNRKSMGGFRARLLKWSERCRGGLAVEVGGAAC